MADQPEQWQWPLKVVNGSFATVPQDSDDDLAQNILAIARTRPGDRYDAPELGVDPQTFHELPIDTAAIANAIRAHEPRLTLTVEQISPVVGDALRQAAVELEIAYRAQNQEPTDG